MAEPLIPAAESGRLMKDDFIGIVTPVYGGDLPLVVQDSLERMRSIEDKYIFALIHYGGSLGISHIRAGRLLKKRGGRLSALLSVHMTQNAFCKKYENKNKLFEAARQLVTRAASDIRRRKNGTWSTNRIFDYIQLVLFPVIVPLYRVSFRRIGGRGKAVPYREAARYADRMLKASDSCSGCGICEKICPVQNIKLENHRPVWLHNCESCLACHNWCPEHAISGAVGDKDYFYTNPEIRLKDMFFTGR